MTRIFRMLAVVAVIHVPSMRGIEVLTRDLPAAVIHRPYGPDPILVTGGGRCIANNMSFRVIQGRLPDGVSLSSGGYLSGVPRETGTFPFMVRIANECTTIGRSFALRVEGAPILSISPATLHFQYQIGGPLPEPARVLVAASWKDLPYWIEAEGASWVDFRPLLGRTPPEGHAMQADPVLVSVDPSKLKPGVYRTSIRAVTWQGTNEARIPLVLTISEP
ncbi:MAG: hypothetical protein JNL98_19635 [Bryobacterales bacterium]|nr:hypothetical protein [Bryobacterales bacterium]